MKKDKKMKNDIEKFIKTITSITFILCMFLGVITNDIPFLLGTLAMVWYIFRINKW